MQNKELYGAMRYLGQFAVILTVSCAGEVIKRAAGLPIPGSIYGLVLMLAALITGIIKLPQVEETADFLVSIMPVMFIPAAVGLMDVWGVLSKILLPVTVITVITTVMVMTVTGHVTQLFMSLKKGGK